MKITTIKFGEIEVDSDKIIFFESGLFGFEQLKKYLLIKTDDEFFYWLNSIDEPEIAFPLVGTRLLEVEYKYDDDFESFGIVNLNRDPLKIVVNLKAPVFINQNEKKGHQKIFDLEEYSLNYSLFRE
jgi:flagellar assembly factor FliW